MLPDKALEVTLGDFLLHGLHLGTIPLQKNLHPPIRQVGSMASHGKPLGNLPHPETETHPLDPAFVQNLFRHHAGHFSIPRPNIQTPSHPSPIPQNRTDLPNHTSRSSKFPPATL